jgi:hypothetical protein
MKKKKKNNMFFPNINNSAQRFGNGSKCKKEGEIKKKYDKGYDDQDEYGREIHCFDSHLKHVNPISKKGKVGAFPREN